jgi:hypothetical protein
MRDVDIDLYSQLNIACFDLDTPFISGGTPKFRAGFEGEKTSQGDRI